MDEITAYIDYKAEEKIHKVMMDKFKDKTIITIAHRIHTIISYDKILALDMGNLVEFDKPEILLKDKNSLFYKLKNNN